MHGKTPSAKGETPRAECPQAEVGMGEELDLTLDCMQPWPGRK